MSRGFRTVLRWVIDGGIGVWLFVGTQLCLVIVGQVFFKVLGELDSPQDGSGGGTEPSLVALTLLALAPAAAYLVWCRRHVAPTTRWLRQDAPPRTDAERRVKWALVFHGATVLAILYLARVVG